MYQDNRAPLVITVTSAWFAMGEGNFAGLVDFLDSLQSYNDVFLVSNHQVVDWMKNPVPASEYSSEVEFRSQSCTARTCTLMKEDEFRYMRSCVVCPQSYPWIGNPLGTF